MLLDFLSQKMKVMHVENVEEAIALASRLQQEKEYDWFRGQVRCWSPASSLERKIKNTKDQKFYEEKLSRFIGWAKATPGLEYLADEINVDAVFAILQHYGFPTTYIDFTTDPSVAGFFASDCATPPTEPGNSVIYCLNTSSIRHYYEKLRSSDKHSHLLVELINIDVKNLWRLQAQHGQFLFTNHNWYNFFEMDRIEFPWTGYPAYPIKEQIYPIHKSSLEQALDHYFHNEKNIESHRSFIEINNKLNAEGKGVKVFTLHPLSDGYVKSIFREPLKPLESWSEKNVSNWFKPTIEQFSNTVGRVVKIQLRSDPAAPSAAIQITSAVSSALKREVNLRNQAIEWRFNGIESNSSHNLFEKSICSAWNGMRNLPFSDSLISETFGAIAELCLSKEALSLPPRITFQHENPPFEDARYINFGTTDGAESYAYCSSKSLLSAINVDWSNNFLNGPCNSITPVLQNTQSPNLVFDFEKFVEIFARQIIPTQLLTRQSNRFIRQHIGFSDV